ncbi:hypothetical protein L345_15644, partial [Ophiophagus hannah]
MKEQGFLSGVSAPGTHFLKVNLLPGTEQLALRKPPNPKCQLNPEPGNKARKATDHNYENHQVPTREQQGKGTTGVEKVFERGRERGGGGGGGGRGRRKAGRQEDQKQERKRERRKGKR